MTGLININKPTGYSSSDVVVVVRGILRRLYNTKNIKVGHLGTLDMGGSGVLPIVFGKATRLFDYLSGSDKKYRAEFVFGKSTDTLDAYGTVTGVSNKTVSLDDFERILPRFVGEIEQIPPKYSRVSVGGIRGSDAMRKGLDIEMPKRKVTINSIDIVDFKSDSVVLDVSCSGGTYIRSLCSDMAAALGTQAYMGWIIRLETKGLKIEDSVTIDELGEKPNKYIQPIDALLDGLNVVDISDRKEILRGIPVSSSGITGDTAAMIDGRHYGIVKDGGGFIKTLVNLYEY